MKKKRKANVYTLDRGAKYIYNPRAPSATAPLKEGLQKERGHVKIAFGMDSPDAARCILGAPYRHLCWRRDWQQRSEPAPVCLPLPWERR